jgi:endonuclease/exonuclease/phosphatase (EEP) superfamily protein YafD
VAVAGLATLACALTPAIDAIGPEFLVPLQSLGRLWIAVGIAGALIAVVSRAWGGFAAFTVAALAPLVTLATFQGAGCDPGATNIRVMSFNARLAGADVKEIVDAANDQKADVLVLVETTEDLISRVQAAGLNPELKFRSAGPVNDNGATGSVILSRYPMEPVAVEQKAVAHEQPAVKLDVDGNDVIVRAIHTLPPVGENLTAWRDGLREIGQWQQSLRGQEVIVVGDFNASRAHAPFRDASKGMRDAMGRWAQPTWPNDRAFPPFATIDHILTRGFTSTDAGVLDISGSDHRAIHATVSLCGS